jgi:isoquinoline 1-oxidoreductase subunit beta
MGKLRTIARRTFLTGLVAVTGGVAVGYYYYQKELPNPLLANKAEGDVVFNPYVKIGTDGKITVMAPRAEMGQGISTTLAALVAEELDVPLSMITVEHGPASAAYANTAMMENGVPFPEFDHSFTANSMRSVMGVVAIFLSLHVTGGSSSTVDAFEKMRHAGAVAREVLKQAAAKKLGVSAETLTTENGTVKDATGKSFSYGELAADATKLTAPSKITLRDRSSWKILGKPQQRVDMLAKVTGAPVFGVDVRLPDMLFATVKMNPKIGGVLKSFDATQAKTIKGVVDVIEIKSYTQQGIAVIADNTWTAFKAAELVKVEWGDAPYPATTDAIVAITQNALKTGTPDYLRNIGDTEAAFKAEGAVIEAQYHVPHLAHACMEPMNTTAQFKDGKLTLWSPNQAPTVVQQVCAYFAGIEKTDVEVHTTMMGGGFGRRGEVDFAIYATLVGMKTGGKPVKVTWSREEDMTHDAYRPASSAHFTAKIGADGMPTALDAKVAAPAIAASVLKRTFPSIPAGGTDPSIVEGSFNQPYAFPHLRVGAITVELDIPVGFWRSVGSSNNGFFHESFIDEIAVATKQDPLTLRLKMMEPYPVARKVVETVAEMSNWSAPKQQGRAKGMAFALSFGTWVAMVVEVVDTPSGIKIVNLWAAADIGTALDPEIIRAQIMSAAVYGLSAAMNQQITFADGEVEQKNFNDFDAMRIWQCPKFEITILENSESMGGAGEPGTPPAAPALANAIFALTGKRIRTLPLSREVAFA